MKNLILLVVAFFATASLSLVGCNNDTNFANVPISGKITCDGAPVAGIRVLFTPEPTAGNNMPGPWAMGLTDANGEYSIVDRYKKDGAVAGAHAVSFSYDDIDEDAEEELQEDMEEAQSEDGSKADFDEAKRQLAELKQKKNTRPKVHDDFSMPFTVPEGGTTEANFDLPAR